MAEPGARVLLADCDLRTMSAVRLLLYKAGFDVTDACDSGAQALAMTRESEPDIVVLGTVLRDTDGLSVLRRIPGLALSSMPAAVMLLSPQAELRRQAQKAGACMIVSLPATAEDIICAVRAVRPIDRLLPRFAQDERIQRILDWLSVSRSLKGYAYLVTAVNIACRSRAFYRAMTTVVYPETARQHGVGAAQVERCIRHALDVAWTKGDLERQYAYFGNTIDDNRGKPTNSEFIARVTEALRLEAK